MSKFGFSSTAIEVIKGHYLKNRKFIVTGASSGIVVETVRALAIAGAHIVCAVRDVVKGEKVAMELRESTKNPNIEVEKLELDNLASVRDFVKRFLATKRPLHCLINNAGVGASPHKDYTVDGFELRFGTNYMGSFVLTIGLLPALIEAFNLTGKKSRVINVSSRYHMGSDIVYDDINFKFREYESFKAYAQSKTAIILFSVALTHFYSDQGVVSNALHPGFILTPLLKHLTREKMIEVGWMNENGQFLPKNTPKSVEQGASTSVWAAVAEELDGQGGLYLENCQIGELKTVEEIQKDLCGYASYAVDKENALKLWNLSMQWAENPPK